MKRLIDVFGALVLMMMASPIIVIAAVAVRVSSTGPIIYGATRFGRNGTVFRCLKFRTMYVDQERRLLRDGRSNRGPRGELLILPGDPRITPVGRFLRKTSIDELPQLWNVLRGEMSLVGPRPLVTDLLESYGTIRSSRGVVRPGITGLWQVRNRKKNVTVLDMIDDDLEYIASRSLTLDVRILIETMGKLLEPRE